MISLSTPFLVGGRLMWETPVEGLRVGGSIQTLRLDASLLTKNMPVNVRIPATLWVGSLEYLANDFLLAAEYSRWSSETDSDNPKLYPAVGSTTSERAYLMVGYRLTKWLQPGGYYSVLFPDTAHQRWPDGQQHDVATTLRFDINSHLLVKLEGHYMIGTAGLSPTINGGTKLGLLEPGWEAFFVKTTGYF